MRYSIIKLYHRSFYFTGHAIGSGKGFHPTSLVEATARGIRTHINDMSPIMKLNCIFGEYMRDSYDNHYFYKASNLIRTAREGFDKALADYDVMVMPTIPFRPPKLPTATVTKTGEKHYRI